MSSAVRLPYGSNGIVRRAAIGLLAGALSFLVILAAMELLFLLAGFMSMLGEMAKLHGLGMEEQLQFPPHLLLLGLLNAGVTILSHIWAIRSGFLVLGAIGAITGVAQYLSGHLGQRRSQRMGLLTMMGMMSIAVLAWELVRRQKIHELLVGHPQYFAWRDVLLESLSTTLIVGLVLAAIAAYLLWEVWRWWDRQLATLLRVRALPERGEAVSSSRWLYASGIVLAGCLLGLIPAVHFYQREGPDTISGQSWLDGDTPYVVVPLRLDRPPNRVAVSNVQGIGEVDIYISDSGAPGSMPLRRGERLTLTDDIRRYSYSEIPLAGLPPGTYYLYLGLRGQDGRGLMRYIVLERGTELEGLAAGVLTSFLVVALVSALNLTFELHDLVRTI